MLLDNILEQIQHSDSKPVIAVAAAGDEEVIQSVALAAKEKIASFKLFGNEEKIRFFLNEQGLHDTEGITVVPCGDNEASLLAVQAVKEQKAHIVMKGMVSTSSLLKAVLHKEQGLRTGKILSHIAAFEVQGYDRLIYVTDAAMNIAPDLAQKAEIIQNAITFAASVGTVMPKVAVIAAVETVNPAMQPTLDAAALAVMNKRGQITGGIVEGPFALDNAISLDAAEHKGIHGEVAGKADILAVPSIETGNVLYKSLMYFAKAKAGAVILGAKAPVVLTSRADSAESKFYSIALAVRSLKS
ncbi:phosphate butyryltransferase [Fictibacillus aquaticus]|uniref:phosphate butyryltransferase n=1 Tax=Fictibacillus aquaticus TaxID=2021314 RepID=UPI001055E136|nr:phosphate butyryltransferase [Fictibacillus aquaticus]